MQSNSHESRDLLARFELFLESSLRNFETEIVSQARFEDIRKGAIEKLRHPAENIKNGQHSL